MPQDITNYVYLPTNDLNRFLREYGRACVSNTTPPAPDGFTNVTWNLDNKTGTITAYVPNGGGSSIDLQTNGANNGNQNKLNLQQGTNVTLVDAGNGTVTISATGGGGGGGVNPGSATQLAFYATTGSEVSGSNLLSDGNFLTVPGLFTSKQDISQQHKVFPTGVNANSEYNQSYIAPNIVGAGWSLGNNGGWTVSKAIRTDFFTSVRGISQMVNIVGQKYGSGDFAGLYINAFGSGGISAPSDEGVTAITAEITEVGGFLGTIASTTGTGDTAPVLSFTSGSSNVSDGAMLLNISKGTLSGRITGYIGGVSFTGPGGTYNLNLPQVSVSGVTLPLLTKVGSTIGVGSGPTWNGHTTNDPQPVTLNLAILTVQGVANPFSVGDHVFVAGNIFCEQSIVTAAGSIDGSGNQSVTFNLRNPNPILNVFCGGCAGQFLSLDANLAGSGTRSSYYCAGSVNGTSMIAFKQIAGSTNNVTPEVGHDFGQADGSANSAFHLYPGAEVVANLDGNFNIQLEQNNVAFAVSDVVDIPNYPVAGGNGLLITKSVNTPATSVQGMYGFQLRLGGPGWAGGNVQGIRIINSNSPSLYTADGGLLAAPDDAYYVQGQFKSILHAVNGPQGDEFIKLDNYRTGATGIAVIALPDTSMLYDISSQTWSLEQNISTGHVTASGITSPGGDFTGGTVVANAVVAGAYSHPSGVGSATFDNLFANHITTTGSGDMTIIGAATFNGSVSCTAGVDSGFYSTGGHVGVTGTFLSGDGTPKTVTVTNGIITSIV